MPDGFEVYSPPLYSPGWTGFRLSGWCCKECRNYAEYDHARDCSRSTGSREETLRRTAEAGDLVAAVLLAQLHDEKAAESPREEQTP